MNKTTVIIVSIVVCAALGASIVAWSVYRKGPSEREEGAVIELTDSNFSEEVMEASQNRPVVVDFYAEWCFPCRLLEPILAEVAQVMQGRAVIGKVDVDKNLISRKLGIGKLPTIIIIRDGEVKHHFEGVMPKEMLLKLLERYGA